LNPDPDPAFQVNPDPGFLRPKTEKKNTARKFSFFDQKLQFTYVQATGEAFSPQKRTEHPALQKNKIY
jgi:hypothetical protein